MSIFTKRQKTNMMAKRRSVKVIAPGVIEVDIDTEEPRIIRVSEILYIDCDQINKSANIRIKTTQGGYKNDWFYSESPYFLVKRAVVKALTMKE